jgi:toxin secretion/phage lysis holin
MNEQFDWIRAVAGLIGGAAAAIWGQVDTVLQVLLVLMALDVASGVLVAGTNGALDSHRGVLGLRKKAATLLVVGAVHWAQPYLGALPAAAALTGAFAMMEFLSIVENAGLAGVQYPPFLRDALGKLRAQAEGTPTAPPR